jgi:WD40 repeat protein/serine/threonine protein kinase
MADKDNLSGRKIGEFVLRERIGEGGFGAVYSCNQPLLGREAVIKVLHRKLRRSDIIVQRFLREAQLASRLDHPYAAHVYAFGIEEQDKLLWIAMERVHGVTLAQWLQTHGPMPLSQFVPFFEHIASVVQTAHESGILHRDLKPSNVMVLERAGALMPKLLDFGVAKLLDGAALPEGMPEFHFPPSLATDDSGDSPISVPRPSGPSTVPGPAVRQDSRLTQNNHTVGSPPYISPEQWSSAIAVGPASDLYALAVVAFEALTGRRPFEGGTMADYADLHCFGEIPALGGDLPPTLDRMFQRALAKRPADRWSTAVELAAALRAAAGIGASSADLPRLDASMRDAWLAAAPQPLAELVAALDDARNAHQAHIAIQELVRSLLRYLLVLALTAQAEAQAREGQYDPALLELVRALDRRELSTEERVQLLRLLVRPFAARRGEHPVPELVALVTPLPDGTDGLEPIGALHSTTDHAFTEDAARLHLIRLVPELTRLLRRTTFVIDLALVVPSKNAAERWSGRRGTQRAAVEISDGKLIEGHPTLLDRARRVCVDLWPLAQTAPPTEDLDGELFLFDGHGHHGSLMIAAPSGREHHDAVARDWLVRRVITRVENKMRMREQIRIAAQQWQDRVRSTALLWRGEVLGELERWTRHTSETSLGELESSFISASRRAARRSRWIRRLLVAASVGAVLAGIEYRRELRVSMVEQIAELEQGRQALLHDDLAEAHLHLAEAYGRGDHSPSTSFMLARALQPSRAEEARFASSTGHMWSALFSPDGRQIVTTDEVSARLWDARTRRLIFTLRHGDIVYDAHFTSDGGRLITACGDGTVRIWDTMTGAIVHTLKQQRADGPPPRYFVVAISPDNRLVAAIDSAGAVANVWEAASGAPVAELRNDASAFPSIAFSSDSRWLATSGGDDVRVFDTRTWSQAVTIAGPRMRALAFDPTGPRLATGSDTGDASIWEVPSGARARHLREVGESIGAIAYAPDGQLVVAGSHDGAEQVWNAKTGALASQLNVLRQEIMSVEFDPASRLVVAAGDGKTVVVADAALGMSIAVLEGQGQGIRSAHFDPTSQHVIGASRDDVALVWDATSPYRRWSSSAIADGCGLAASLEPDRRFIAIGCGDHATQIWDTANNQLLAELPSVTPVDGDFASAFPAVSADGDRAAIARGHAVEIYELPSGRRLRTVEHHAPVNAVAFASSGHDLVSGATDGSLLITRDGREPAVLPSSPGGIDAAGFLPDGRLVAVDARQHLRVIDPDRVAVLADLAMPSRVRMLRPSPDGHRLVTVANYTGKPAAPILWDLDGYRLVAQLEGHVGRVFSARYVAAGIVTMGNDGIARLWDSKTARLLQTYHSRIRFLADAVVDPEGSLLVAGGSDGQLWFWDLATGRVLWKFQAHKSHVVGIHFEGDEIVTRGFAGDISRWRLPPPAQVIEQQK